MHMALMDHLDRLLEHEIGHEYHINLLVSEIYWRIGNLVRLLEQLHRFATFSQ